MQFIEKNSFSLRTAIYSLKHKESSLEFMLFPMVHVGEPQYYEEINSLLSKCEVILYEGVRSRITKLITLSYRLLAKKKGIGLIAQNEALRLGELSAELVHADMSTEMFEAEWARLPLKLRILMLLASPIVGLFQKLFGKKLFLALIGNVNDLPDGNGCSSEDSQFSKLIITERDKFLINKIEEQLCTRTNKATVGIVYGAKHIPAVAYLLLNKHKYHVASAQWVTVASFN